MEALEQIMYLHMMRIIPLVSSLPEKAGPAEAVEAEHGEGERERERKEKRSTVDWLPWVNLTTKHTAIFLQFTRGFIDFFSIILINVVGYT